MTTKNKNNLVFVGGFGNGKSAVEQIAEQLGKHLNVNDVMAFTLSDARRNPDELIKRMKDAKLAASHSAGALALTRAGVKSAEHMFINAPTPTTRLHLLGSGLLIAGHMTRDALRDPELRGPTAKFNLSYGGELVSHLISNLWPLINGEIPEFNSRAVFGAMSEEGVKVTDIQTIGDEYFPSDSDSVGKLWTPQGVETITVEGGHNRVLVDPRMLDEVFYHMNNPNPTA